MEKLVERISREVENAFSAAGFDPVYGKVSVSNRPDLCQFQCNGSLPAAKQYKKAPMQIAQAVCAKLAESRAFRAVTPCMPGFINLDLSDAYLAEYLEQMRGQYRFGVPQAEKPQKIILDYGGPNVAKPLHVGHLRSAIIGESLKRIFRYFGHTVIGDIHMGDWGLQMGLIIAELAVRKPELVYFDENYSGAYPAEPPFTISELEEIYPAASAKSKQDPAFAEQAHQATYALQHGRPGYRALWEQIMAVSVADLKRNYEKLDVHFDLWMGESDAQPYIEPMLEKLKAAGVTERSNGALVVPVEEPTDSKPIPPCILLKSDGATLYATTDLATILERMEDYHPDRMFYVTDKRQNLHFEQFFRAARKGGLVPEGMPLEHLGFGTMNGKDGKPFKTRDGGIMRLETLIAEITDFVHAKIADNGTVDADKMDETARLIAMAALKYGDLSNLPTKDYVFDLDRFAAFEGNTGPYILYTIVRVKSILARYCGKSEELAICPIETEEGRSLMLAISRFQDNLMLAYRDYCPSAICAYLYELAGAVNKFYHETKILSEPDPARQAAYIAVIRLAKAVLETGIDLLGFAAPEKM